MIRITGQYSYHRDTQRDIQFRADIREIGLGRRVWQGEESELNLDICVVNELELQRTIACMGWRSS